ncbi:MAG: DUF418 domain-containing protein [Bacteroidetes bacterium]|nr:DUF418 domain-containing protein [Bacteroidota bacterium]
MEQVFYIALAILTVQLLISNLWFVLFSFGLIEWLWRCAAFGKLFPIRKKRES